MDLEAIEKRRAELQTLMDQNAVKAGELAAQNRAYQKEYRELELKEHEARAKLAAAANTPTGIVK